MLPLPVLCAAVLRGKVDFEELSDVLREMIRAWPDIRAFLILNCAKYLTHRAVEAHGIDVVIWSQFVSGLDDASCRTYGELCYFTWNLLSKVK